MTITPSIGRQVWYVHGGARLDGMAMFYPGDKEPTQPMAATVIYVWGDRCVNLDVIDHAGQHHAKTSVPLLQNDDPAPDFPHCRWMPHQLGQAKAFAPAS